MKILRRSKRHDFLIWDANFVNFFRKIGLATGRVAWSIGGDAFAAVILVMSGNSAEHADLFGIGVARARSLLLLLRVVLALLLLLRWLVPWSESLLLWLLSPEVVLARSIVLILIALWAELRLNCLHIELLIFLHSHN